MSVLCSVLINPQFLKLSDVEILKVLKENECISSIRTSYQCSIRFLLKELARYSKKHQTQENQIVKNLGGLYIIGTERNDSKRVDNQLRGRCGRQGDPGISRFFLSLDDNLLRLFGGPKIQNFMKAQMIDDEPLEYSLLTRSLNKAQGRVEARAYQQRKNLFDYDDVLNKQRNIVYYERSQILKAVSVQQDIFVYGEQVITDILESLKISGAPLVDGVMHLEKLFGKSFIFKDTVPLNLLIESSNLCEVKIYLFDEFWLAYRAKLLEVEIYGEDIAQNFERTIILINTDRMWREHLQQMTFLREAVGWRGYGQRNPLYEYKRDAFSTFEKFEKTLRQLIIYELFRSTIA